MKLKINKNIYLAALFLISVSVSFLAFSSAGSATIPPNETDAKIVNQVFENSVAGCANNQDCYSKKFYQITLKYGHETAFSILDRLVSQKPEYSYCHFFAHAIGHGAYEKDPANWRNTLNSISQTCSYGAFHGILEQYAYTLQSKEENITDKKVLQGICDGKMGSCPHILGHIILVYEEADVVKSVGTCQAFKDESYKWCLNGVFMEHTYPKTLVEHGLRDKSALNTSGKLPSLKILRFVSDPTFHLYVG
jgi:hypothetical protein